MTDRRSLLLALLGAGLAAPADRAAAASGWPGEVPLGPTQSFSFQGLSAQARLLAARPFRLRPGPAADQAHAVDYDAFGRIAYRPDRTLWGKAPGANGIRFFPLGRYAPRPVTISVVQGGQARQVLYSPDLFTTPVNSPIRHLGPHVGFSGFRVMNADKTTDWLAFMGASYFRAADPFNQYGLSVRGLALDTATAHAEEFPDFTAFWLEPGATGPTVYALLDGPSVTGAYRIVNQRTEHGLVQEVTAELNFRRGVERLGIAPLTSMYWYSQSDRPAAADWRPQIHDSDGLSMWTGAGERLWRPLANPNRVAVNAFMDRNPRGFGLMQRDRRFADYQDDGVFYERRPSVWVEPIGDWGAGSVQLVEIPANGETEDNIVAFWTPAEPVRPGLTLTRRYRLHWTDQEPAPLGVARVVATREGRGGPPGGPFPPGQRRFVVDFAGGSLAGLSGRGDAQPMVTASRGQPTQIAAYPVVGGQGMWRLVFDIDFNPASPPDLRAYLKRGEAALTETWLFQPPPA